jgi:type IV secretory pathway VirB10-like protein
MKLSARSAALYSVTFAGLLALSACGKNEQQSTNQPASASTAPAAPSTAAKPAPASTAAAPAPAHTAAAPAAATPAPASTAPAAAAATPAANSDSFQVSAVTLGDTVTADHKVRKEVTTFAPNQKTIYASVDTSGTTEAATLTAKWSYLEGSGSLVMSTSQSINADGPGTTTFRVVNPNLWPEGKYKVDILLDGKQAASKTFEIKKS